jgi:hypothetical protein
MKVCRNNISRMKRRSGFQRGISFPPRPVQYIITMRMIPVPRSSIVHVSVPPYRSFAHKSRVWLVMEGRSFTRKGQEIQVGNRTTDLNTEQIHHRESKILSEPITGTRETVEHRIMIFSSPNVVAARIRMFHLYGVRSTVHVHPSVHRGISISHFFRRIRSISSRASPHARKAVAVQPVPGVVSRTADGPRRSGERALGYRRGV